jgi:hypothetical protein
MISKLVAGGLLALLVSACGDAAIGAPTPQENGDLSAQSAQAADEDGSFENVKLRAHRTPPRLRRFDANHDGVLQQSELPARLQAWFTEVDANHDKVVTADEIRAYNRAHPHPHHGQHHQHAAGQTPEHVVNETTL